MTLLAPIFRMLRLALFCLSSIDIETSLASIAKIFPYDHGQFHYIFYLLLCNHFVPCLSPYPRMTNTGLPLALIDRHRMSIIEQAC